MERLVKGDVVVLDFPFSDLKFFKRRPALVLKAPKGQDIIVAQITAGTYDKDVEVILDKNDFSNGGLKRTSYVRIDKITTIKETRVKYKIGSLKSEKFAEVLERVVGFLKS